LGKKPAPPDSIDAIFSNNILHVIVYDQGDNLVLTATIQYPATGAAPYPAVIGVGSGSGSLPSDLFLNKGVATIEYNFSEVAPWTQSGRGQGEFYRLFPDTKVGYLTAWTWGVSRLIDGLQKVEATNIDTKHLAITGCSFAGKIALFSGAFDERIALTIAQEPGGGGDASWRVTETLSGSRETLSNAQSYGWYHEDVNQFNNAVTKLPFDHHEVMAMIAPRALLVLGNPDFEWLADESGYVACMAAQDVWTALGVPDRFGFSKVGGHGHCALPNNQRPEVSAFIEKFLLGDETANTDIAIHPDYSSANLSKWIQWNLPALKNDTSYFEKTSLISPPNNATNTDTSVTFKWHPSPEAEKYIIQLTVNSSFLNNVISDSTADTVLALPELEKGKKYYWRVQIKSHSGSYGPFSDFRNFTTAVPLPEAPRTLDAIQYPSRSDYINLRWHPVEYAEKYLVHISKYKDFNNIFITSFASDTAKVLKGTNEGTPFFWRVRAKNIAGYGNWSDTSNFVIILPPTNLILEGEDHTVTLTWQDNSEAEEGYLIERKSGSLPRFTILDTVAENIKEYKDKSLNSADNYVYRVAAFIDSSLSDYSNEVATTIVGTVQNANIPNHYALSQNYPNPFNPTTKIKFALPKSGFTQIALYNLQGDKIKDLLSKEMTPGYHEIKIDARSLPSGIYIYKILSGAFSQSKKMVLMK